MNCRPPKKSQLLIFVTLAWYLPAPWWTCGSSCSDTRLPGGWTPSQKNLQLSIVLDPDHLVKHDGIHTDGDGVPGEDLLWGDVVNPTAQPNTAVDHG